MNKLPVYLVTTIIGVGELPGNGDLRLNTEGSTRPRPFSGRLEISYFGGSWGTICEDQFTQNNADVACRQLGFFGALYSEYGSNTLG